MTISKSTKMGHWLRILCLIGVIYYLKNLWYIIVSDNHKNKIATDYKSKRNFDGPSKNFHTTKNQSPHPGQEQQKIFTNSNSNIGNSNSNRNNSINAHNQSIENFYIPVTTSPIQALTKELESSTIRYYVYDDDIISLPKIRSKALLNHNATTWNASWGLRFAEYAKGEIRWLEALENHPLRTYNTSEAAFFLVPIPLGASIISGSGKDISRAFRQVFGTNITTRSNKSTQLSLFQQYPEKHVSGIASTEKAFVYYWDLSDEELSKFKPTTVIRDSDDHRFNDWLYHHQRTNCKLPRNKSLQEQKYFSHVVTLGYGGGGSSPSNAYQPVTMKNWKNKTFWTFYHSRRSPFLCNSTIFRHRLLPDYKDIVLSTSESNVNNNIVNITQPPSLLTRLKHQPVSIGFDIPSEQWKAEFIDSKFCLVIRGDQPGSRSFDRAIRAGCMPLIISDALPAFMPIKSKHD